MGFLTMGQLAALSILATNWKNRLLLVDFTHRELKLRYLGSLFGKLWNIFSPLAMIAIYTFIFSVVMETRFGSTGSAFAGNRFAFVVFLCSALLPWNALIETMSRGTNVFLDNAHLLKKVAFPMELLPLSMAATAGINFLISYGLFLLLCLNIGTPLGAKLLLLPVLFLLQTVFALGITLLLATLNVFFRDIQQLVGIVFSVWFWTTPIVYEWTRVPEQYLPILYANPFFYFAQAYQQVIFYDVWPSLNHLLIMVALSLASFLLGASVFQRFKPEIMDQL